MPLMPRDVSPCPSEWRDASYESHLFVVPSSSQCVRVYPASWLSETQAKIAGLKDGDVMRKKMRDLSSIVQGTTWDQQGRIMVKERLRNGAGLKKESMLVGRLDFFEIWDKAAWEAQPSESLTVEEGAQRLGPMSIFEILDGTYTASAGAGRNRRGSS